MGILLVKAKPGAEILPPSGHDRDLARWLIEQTGEGQAAGYRLVDRIRDGTALFAERERPIAGDLLARLRCPDCLGALERAGSGVRCAACGTEFAGEYGVPILYPVRFPEPRAEGEWMPRLCGDDARRRRVVHRVASRLRRNEQAPGPLRRLFRRADRWVNH